jgi:regulator of sigma E protease
MSFLLTIAFLALVIAIHEFGHFIVAKWCNVGVIEFAIGFGPLVFSKVYGETRYSLRAIPLGGFVRMVGEDISGPVEDLGRGEKLSAGAKATTTADSVPAPEELHPALKDKNRWFSSKTVGQRAAVIFAGPFFNFASAVIISIGVLLSFGITEPTEEPVVGSLIPGYPAEKAGLKPGDRILAIDGAPIEKWVQLSKTINASEGRPLTLNVQRKDEAGALQVFDLTLRAQPDSPEMVFMEGGDGPRGVKVGVTVAMKRVDVSVVEALWIGTVHPINVAAMSLKGIWGLLSGQVSAKNISGPIFIVGESMKSADRGFADLLEFVVFLSISLAVLNLLPIPVLDGGHLMLLAIEAVRGVPLGERASGLLARTGMVALLSLMVFALSNDIGRLLGFGH